jgi:hypothetical protein
VLYLGEINDQQQAAWRKTLCPAREDRGMATEYRGAIVTEGILLQSGQ